MNYLAHAYLSFQNPQLEVGNMIGDFIKGKKYNLFEGDIRKGLRLHRAIDTFTDEHAITREAKSYLKPSFRLSSGIFTDIIFDYYLANHTTYFNDESLRNFTQRLYQNLDNHKHLFSAEMSTLFGFMITYDWLYNYRNISGIERSVRGICQRHPMLGDSEKALELLSLYDKELSSLFNDFFPLLEAYCIEWIEKYK